MLNLVSGISWQTKLIVFVAALAISFTAGWRVHEKFEQANTVPVIKQAIKTNTKLQKKSDQIVEKKLAKEQEVRIVYRTIHERIDNAPSDRVCFSPESLSMWNDAISAGADTHRPKPQGKAGGDAAAGASEKDILRNATTNFEICNRNSIRHNALIDQVEALEGKMCVCQE